MRNNILDQDVGRIFDMKVRECLPIIREDIQKELIDKIPNLDMLNKVQHCLDDITKAREEAAQVREDIYERFEVIGHDVKEVYVQLDAAFAKTIRERSNMQLQIKEFEDQMSNLGWKSATLNKKVVKLDHFMEDVITA